MCGMFLKKELPMHFCLIKSRKLLKTIVTTYQIYDMNLKKKAELEKYCFALHKTPYICG